MSGPGAFARYAGPGVVALAVVVAGLGLGLPATGLVGFRTYTVLTGSMAPTLPVGSLIVDEAISAAAARPGDVISFSMPSDPSLTVTHRVERLAAGPGGEYLVTRGDANPVADAWRVPAAARVGRVVLAIPLAGYLGTLWGRLLLVLGATAWILRPRRSPGRRPLSEPVPA